MLSFRGEGDCWLPETKLFKGSSFYNVVWTRRGELPGCGGLPCITKARRIGLGRVAEGRCVLTFPQHPFGLLLQLPDPLLGDAQFLAEMGDGGGLLVVEAVAPYQHVPLALGQALHGL